MLTVPCSGKITGVVFNVNAVPSGSLSPLPSIPEAAKAVNGVSSLVFIRSFTVLGGVFTVEGYTVILMVSFLH